MIDSNIEKDYDLTKIEQRLKYAMRVSVKEKIDVMNATGRGSEQVLRWLRGDIRIPNPCILKFAELTGFNPEWISTGRGPKRLVVYGSQKHLQTISEISALEDSEKQTADKSPEQLIAENAFKIINLDAMDELIRYGADKEAEAFTHIYRRVHNKEVYKIRFVAYVEKEVSDPAPKNDDKKKPDPSR